MCPYAAGMGRKKAGEGPGDAFEYEEVGDVDGAAAAGCPGAGAMMPQGMNPMMMGGCGNPQMLRMGAMMAAGMNPMMMAMRNAMAAQAMSMMGNMGNMPNPMAGMMMNNSGSSSGQPNMPTMPSMSGMPSIPMPEQAPVDARVKALCKEFSIDDQTCRTLHDAMKSREDYDEDIQALHQVMERAVNKGKKPLEVMLTQIRAIKAGRFAGKELLDKDIWAFAEKYNLDDRVLNRLIQTLNGRRSTKKADLKALDERLSTVCRTPPPTGSTSASRLSSAQQPTGLGLLVRLLEGLEETGRLLSPPRRLGGSGTFHPTGTFLHPTKERQRESGRDSRDGRDGRDGRRDGRDEGRRGGDGSTDRSRASLSLRPRSRSRSRNRQGTWESSRPQTGGQRGGSR